MPLKTALWTIVFLVLPFLSLAQENRNNLLQELYNKSGLEIQAAQLPSIIQYGFDESLADDNHLRGLSRGVVAEIRKSVKTAFKPEIIKKTVLSELKDALSMDVLKNVLGWLYSPLGKKFTQLEESASTPEKYIAIQRYALQLRESPPSPERLKIFQQLDSAVGATQHGTEIAMKTQLVVAMATAATRPREQQPTYDNLLAAIEKNRLQIENEIKIQTLVSFLYIYKDVPPEEINRYISFASSPAGDAYHKAAISGLKRALLEGAYTWGEMIGEILQQSETKTDA